MIRVFQRLAPCLIMAVSIAPAWVQAAIWQDLSSLDLAAKGLDQTPVFYRALKADRSQLSQVLSTAPLENTSTQGATLQLPMPDGSMQQFEVVNSPILSPELARAHPDIATYAVRGIDDPSITGRLDLTPAGFHAMLSSPGGTVFIDPDSSGNYRSFYKRDFISAGNAMPADRGCQVSEAVVDAADTHSAALAERTVSSVHRRIYRLAVAATSGYSQYFGNSESLITSNITTAINRINQIYGRDLAVLLELTAVLAYTDPFSDPFRNLTTSQMLAKNQEVLDFEFGINSYDLGHLFDVSGGGLAQLGAACTSLKAHGFSGFPAPDSDVFYIDLLSHEIGHQLDATHSFNGSTDSCGGINRSPITAVEPGSGSTIMAYAGICGGENIQSNSDPVFHAASIQQINGFVFTGTGRNCGTLVTTGNALPTSIDAGPSVTIPQGTPFALTAQVTSDPDGDTLSYQWEQMDAGITPTTVATLGTDQGDNPLFRSFVPKSTPTRFFPRLSSLLSGVSDKAETLPTALRNLNFRVSVRDGNSGLGDDDLVVSVNPTMGPFQINSVTQGSGTLTIDWDPADTSIFCPELHVGLLAFSNDGTTYCDTADNPDLDLNPTPLISNAAGSTTISLPTSLSVTRARLMLSCSTNVFFALSDTDLTITTPNPPVASNCKTVDGETVAHGGIPLPPTNGSLNLGGGGGGALFWLPLWLIVSGLFRSVMASGRRSVLNYSGK